MSSSSVANGPGADLDAARSRLVFALDYASIDAAREAVRQVGSEVGLLKVGLELFIGYGEGATRLALESGLELFLDLKLHDIPETVGRAVDRAASLGARYLTVHAGGGTAMLREAVARAAERRREGASLEIVAVTVLTSLDDGDLASLGVAASTRDHALALARLAWEAGVRGFVCSPAEAAELRRSLGPGATIITPGVRPSGPSGDDQKRTSTPEGAIHAGADRLVVGRPIRDAVDPALAARAIVASIRDALGGTPA
ncbi:MAG: orotidine-5'-phosphate decarboxylase [Deltaproteobacteria bacterium]|nr:orotidine-5'-phosphate decarboxylase [Deltaproteobacteria bacterium]